MLARRIALALPTIALIVVGVMLLGPGAARPVDAARVLGAPPHAAHVLSWRIELRRRYVGVESLIFGRSVNVEAEGTGSFRASARARPVATGAEAIEVSIPWGRGRAPPHAATVTDDDGRVLASGPLQTDNTSWTRGDRFPADLGASDGAGKRDDAGKGDDSGERDDANKGDGPGGREDEGAAQQGRLAVRLAAVRGIFAAPFGDELYAEVTRAGHPVGRAEVEITANGADIRAPSGAAAVAAPAPPAKPGPIQPAPVATRAAEPAPATPAPADAAPLETDRIVLVTDAAGRAHARLTPRSHVVQIDAVAREGTERAAWHGAAPVVPGAIWLDPSSNPSSLRIVSPVVRPFVYLSIADPTARLFGAVVPLTPDARGFAAARVSVPWDRLGGMPAAPAWVIVSSDARERGSGTVGWPLSPSPDPFQNESRVLRDEVLLDGMPSAMAAERDRRRKARSVAVGTLALAGFFEALLLFGVAREGGAALRNTSLWDEIAGIEQPRPAKKGFILLAMATVVLALAAIGLAVVWKLGG